MKKLLFIFMLLALLAFSSQNCKTYDDEGEEVETPPANTVYIYDNFFKPELLTISTPNTVITWVNKGSTSHTVTSDTFSPAAGLSKPLVEKFHSGTLAPGATYQHSFQWEGDWKYYCQFHTGMRAEIKVKF